MAKTKKQAPKAKRPAMKPVKAWAVVNADGTMRRHTFTGRYYFYNVKKDALYERSLFDGETVRRVEIREITGRKK